jgi:hypothetical protein
LEDFSELLGHAFTRFYCLLFPIISTMTMLISTANRNNLVLSSWINNTQQFPLFMYVGNINGGVLLVFLCLDRSAGYSPQFFIIILRLLQNWTSGFVFLGKSITKIEEK